MSDQPQSPEYPPPSNAWCEVFPAGSASFTDILLKHGLDPDSGDRNSFAVKDRYPSLFYLFFCLLGGEVGFGFGHGAMENWRQDFSRGDIPGLGMDVFGVAVGILFVLVGLYGLLSKTVFIFLPDRLIRSTRFFGFGRNCEYQRDKIRGTACLKPSSNSLNWSLRLHMRNEDKVDLVSMGGRSCLSWLAGVIEEWLQRQPLRDEAVEEASGIAASADAESAPGDDWRSGILFDPPEGLKRLSSGELIILDGKLRAAGQAALSRDAVAVECKCPLVVSIVVGVFLLLWLCGWYRGVFAEIRTIFTEGLHGNVGSLLSIFFFGGIGLLPVRVFGSFLFTGTTLVFEPQRLRVRRRHLLFHRDWCFENREIRGFVWGDRVLGIVRTVEIILQGGSSLVLLEDAASDEKSPALRWLTRVLEEKILVKD